MKMVAEDIITHPRTNESREQCRDSLWTNREKYRFSYYFYSFVSARINLYDHGGVYKHGPSSDKFVIVFR